MADDLPDEHELAGTFTCEALKAAMMDHTDVVSTQTLTLQPHDSRSVHDRDQWTCNAVHAPGELVGEWAGTVQWVKGHGEGEVDCTATASVTTAAGLAAGHGHGRENGGGPHGPSSYGPALHELIANHGWNGHGFTGSSREGGGIQLSFEGECAAMPSANLLANRSLFMQYSPQELPCTVRVPLAPVAQPSPRTRRFVQPRLLSGLGWRDEWSHSPSENPS